MTPAQVAAEIARLSQDALDEVMARIRRGQTSRSAIESALAQFRGPYYVLIAEALSERLHAAIGPAVVRNYPVGKITLSQALYAHHRAISLAAASTIAAHMKGPHSARELAKTLYEGYDFKPDTLKVIAALPKYLQVEFNRAKAAKLKTPALRAAYLQAINRAEAGAGMEELAKVLNVALQERNRFYANRIAQTELHRAYNQQRARDWMGQDWVQYLRIRLSATHPKVDICDYHAKVDQYGLGPGIYPKAAAPLPPYHPFCKCMISTVINIPASTKPRYKAKAQWTFLTQMPPEEAARVAGSRERLQRALDGETLETIYNEGKDALYQVQQVGDVPQDWRVAQQRINLLDLPPVDIIDLQGNEFGSDLSKAQLGKAADQYLRALQHGEGLLNTDTGWLLQINKTGRKKMGDNADLRPLEMQAVAGLEALVKAAVLVETHADYAHNNEYVANIHRLYAPLRIRGKLYRVKLTVKEYVGEGKKKNLHALAAVEIENALLGTVPTSAEASTLQSDQPTTGRTLSIKQLLDGASLLPPA